MVKLTEDLNSSGVKTCSNDCSGGFIWKVKHSLTKTCDCSRAKKYKKHTAILSGYYAEESSKDPSGFRGTAMQGQTRPALIVSNTARKYRLKKHYTTPMPRGWFLCEWEIKSLIHLAARTSPWRSFKKKSDGTVALECIRWTAVFLCCHVKLNFKSLTVTGWAFSTFSNLEILHDDFKLTHVPLERNKSRTSGASLHSSQFTISSPTINQLALCFYSVGRSAKKWRKMKLHIDKHYQNSRLSQFISYSPTWQMTIRASQFVQHTVSETPLPLSEIHTSNVCYISGIRWLKLEWLKFTLL